jgi:hypothetical protein
MRRRTSSLVLAGVLLASGGAFAAAQTAAPAPAPSGSTAEPNGGPPLTPPGQAKERHFPPGQAKERHFPPGQAKKADGTAGGVRGRGPDATGPAAYGLCQAWAEQDDPAAKAEHVPPFRNLAAAAGGAHLVEEFCAGIPEPDATGD